MYKIAFIDDGIMSGIQELPEKVTKYRINNGKIEIMENLCSTVCLSHGTICFWVFSEYITDKKYILYDIQILNEFTSCGNMNDLIVALQFCLDEKIDLINMSLGKTQCINSEGDEVLKKLYARGTIMVAAQNNNNQMTYPAYSPYVFGVTRDYVGLLKKGQFCYVDKRSEKIDVISHCEFSDIEMKHNILMGKHNSFSAPYISALIYNQLLKGSKREEILYFLKKQSVLSERINCWEYRIKNMPDWQDKIDVPVIRNEITERDSGKFFLKLINKFREKEFHAVGIWYGQMAMDNEAYIFQYPLDMYKEYEIEMTIKWVYNITRPDLIFLGHASDLELYSENVSDLVLSDIYSRNNKMIYISGKSTNQVVDMITSFFS